MDGLAFQASLAGPADPAGPGLHFIQIERCLIKGIISPRKNF